ncbi:MAG TPA: hypothetical protein VNV66_20470 [Pilimelia sp.]|nr:hypothetical protein [Pilimelia sp.]
MSSRDQQLLREIEEGALDDNTPVAAVLRKCLVLGGRAGSSELRDWARRELRGYDRGEDLPPYRTVPAPIRIDAVLGYNRVTGQAIGPHQLPEVAQKHIKESVPLYFSISELEDMARQEGGTGAVNISLPSASVLVSLMNNGMDEFDQITAVYFSVSRSHLHGVVDKVRTTCTELVAELRAVMPDDQAIPTQGAVDQAVHVVFHGGDRHSVQVVNASAAHGSTSRAHVGSPAPTKESAWMRWRKRGIIVGIATVIAAAAGVVTWLEWKPWE